MHQVWGFNGDRNSFPSAVFTQRHLAEVWILKNILTGTLTCYPLDTGVYEWVVDRGWFQPKTDYQTTPNFIQNFSLAYHERYHYSHRHKSGSGNASPKGEV